ncbi:MAG: hypothetical protein DIU69_09735, partial [Bacillota bacterium]
QADEADNPRLDNVHELTAAAARFSDIPSFLAYADMMATRSQRDDDEAGDKVQIMTIHRSKGLEWPVVFVAGVADGLLPHAMAEFEAEERRLCYVAITRTRDRLYVSCPATYNGKACEPSPFLYEMGLLEAEPLGGEGNHGAVQGLPGNDCLGSDGTRSDDAGGRAALVCDLRAAGGAL